MKATKSDDAVKIRNWLVSNRNSETTKNLLSGLSKAYQVAVRQKLVTHNPFDGLAEEIKEQGSKTYTAEEKEGESDEDIQIIIYIYLNQRL
ncbi:hypothetical protein [Nostoc sp.]|uniref:hypothetical protein n=1 Tax=Nostoc sp. TaxID=1180 RepID=UPI002FF89C88